MSDEKPAHWVVLIGEHANHQSPTLWQAEDNYDRLCRQFPDRKITLCEVIVRPLKSKPPKDSAP
jgi:hypothetical protein